MHRRLAEHRRSQPGPSDRLGPAGVLSEPVRLRRLAGPEIRGSEVALSEPKPAAFGKSAERNTNGSRELPTDGGKDGISHCLSSQLSKHPLYLPVFHGLLSQKGDLRLDDAQRSRKEDGGAWSGF